MVDSVTLPRAMRPASAALSGMSGEGARPICSKMRRNPSQKHSERSENMATQKRALERERQQLHVAHGPRTLAAEVTEVDLSSPRRPLEFKAALTRGFRAFPSLRLAT